MVGERTCKWCRFYNGKCEKFSEIFIDNSSVSSELYELAESGKLSEAITEGLTLPKMSELEKLLESSGIAKKKQKDILKAVRAELEDYIPTIVAGIDDSVSQLIINVDSKVEDMEPVDPFAFYCKYFE